MSAFLFLFSFVRYFFVLLKMKMGYSAEILPDRSFFCLFMDSGRDTLLTQQNEKELKNKL